MPIYEYRCTKCRRRFSEQQGIAEHGRRRAACPKCKSRAVAQLARAERDRPLTEAERSAERAWRDLQQAGGVRPDTDLQGDLLQSDLDRTAREAAADRQLRELKKKMKKD